MGNAKVPTQAMGNDLFYAKKKLEDHMYIKYDIKKHQFEKVVNDLNLD